MVLLQLLRSMGYVGLGFLKRRRALWANPQASIDPLEKQVFPVYAGIRMADIFGHINNSRYLEIAEFARWSFLGYCSIANKLRKDNIAFIVASVDVHFVREMKPCRVYSVSTEFVNLEDTGVPGAGDAGSCDGRVAIVQEVWSSDGRTLHASLLVRVAFLGPANSPIALSIPGRASKHATLSCSGVLARMSGRDVAEVREALRRNREAYEHRLGFRAETEWIDASNRLETEWRARMRGLKSM